MATRRRRAVERTAHEVERGTSAGTPFAVIGGVWIALAILFTVALLAAGLAYWLA